MDGAKQKEDRAILQRKGILVWGTCSKHRLNWGFRSAGGGTAYCVGVNSSANKAARMKW